MKRFLVMLLTLLFGISLVACKPTETEKPSEPNSKLDDNGTDDVDVEKRIDPSLDPNYIDGLDYEYTGDWGHNKDYTKPGFYNPDGTVHELPADKEATGTRINVVMFGAKANDEEFDNTTAVKQAIASAKEGDYIYFPAGKYYFSSNTLSSPHFAHIYIYTNGIGIRGAGKDNTILVSKFSANDNLSKSTATLAVMNASDVTISDLTFTAEVPAENMPTDLSTSRNNPEGNQYAPKVQISVVNTDPIESTRNVVIKNCKISYFQESAIALKKTQDCKVKDCEISDATDIGGGGAGYGICITGNGFESFSMVGSTTDSRYNFISDNTFKGPYLRHAIILSYVTHNNVVYNNSIDGCQDEPLDLHGEDEFLNVFTKNKVANVTKTGIGLGNPGSTHDATGPGNVIYGNEVENALGGIQVSYGTPDTQIYNNVFKNLKEGSTGIRITFGPNTTIRNNEISNIVGESVGISSYYYYVWNDPSIGLYQLDIQSNTIKNVKTAMYFETYKDGTKIKNNQFVSCANEILSDKADFVLPPMSNYFDPVEGTCVYPVQEGNINRGNYESTINPTGYYYFKGSHVEPLFNRVIYEQYNIDRSVLESSSKVYVRITTTSKSAKQHFFFWVKEDLEWEAKELTWGNAPYINNPTNNSSLSWDPSGEYPITSYPYEAKIYDPNNECVLATDFECVAVNESFLTYYIDITDFMKNKLKSDNFTFIITNETMDAAYSSVRNMIGNAETIWPCIIFAE
ncbi:MAG: right-handed parallel beta-helix repeat-containing protein [Anaeroplasmataceae bacterium]|nr:right-handed parallel beta-helix repeat-containing protein [Anaeroplasmataceae bacterium]